MVLYTALSSTGRQPPSGTAHLLSVARPAVIAVMVWSEVAMSLFVVVDGVRLAAEGGPQSIHHHNVCRDALWGGRVLQRHAASVTRSTCKTGAPLASAS